MAEIVEYEDGSIKYFSNGVLHRDDGPAVIETYPNYKGPERHLQWYRMGVLHRDDGPAVIGGRTTNGEYEWWKNGVRHRDDGPAVISLIESLDWGRGEVYQWWKNGILEKVQDGDGIIHYFKDGKERLIELPDGRRIIYSENDTRFEDVDGNDLGSPPCLDAYDGYLEQNSCSYDLYCEPENIFDKFNPADV